MKKLPEDDLFIRYVDEEGNELRVWTEDKQVIGATFRGVSYVVELEGINANHWKKVRSKGKISRDFKVWFEQVERELGSDIDTKKLVKL
ncbi:hypothetical protein CN918_29265 [Priestia megaterium]|nr:hypothetical protein CN918_29265 [Priestia megaterium]